MRTVFAYCHVGISYQILVTNIYITCVIKIHFFIMWLRPYFVYMYPYADPTADEADPTADDGTAPIRFDPIRSDPIRSDQAVPAANIVLPKSSRRCYIADVIVAIFPCHADPTADESWCRTEPIRRR